MSQLFASGANLNEQKLWQEGDRSKGVLGTAVVKNN